jgi:hypothetical protein
VLENFVFGLLLAFLCVRGLLYICNPVLGFEEAFTMNIFRAPLIAAAILAMTPSATFAQVRVITGDIEHYYGPGGQLLDDAELRARNERAESLRLREREDAMRQQELDAAAARAAPIAYDEPYGAQDGSYYIGAFRSRQGRQVNLRRIGTGPVSGNSLQFRHANAQVRR